MTHLGEEVGAGQAGGAAADDGDLLAGLFAGSGHGDLIGGDLIHRELLQTADVHRVVQQAAAAAVLAGVLTDHGTGRGQGVILADQVDRTGVVALTHQRDIAGDVHMGGTHIDAGHLLPHIGGTELLLDMALVLQLEAVQAAQHLGGGLVADGAVRAVPDHDGQLAHLVQGLHGGVAVQDLLQHHRQLRQAVPAGHALAAGLVHGGAQQGILHRQRAGPGGIAEHLIDKLPQKIADLHIAVFRVSQKNLSHVRCSSLIFTYIFARPSA